MENIAFKTDLLRGAKGEKGDAGSTESVPTDGVLAYVGETTPQGYEEIDPADVFTQIYEDIDAVKDIISNVYDPQETYNAGDYCIYEDILYKCNTNATTGVWDANKWDVTNVGEELTNAGEETTTAKETVEDIISDAYDATATYDVGDYCIYNDTLYKCNTAIVTGEAFTPAKWTATNAANEIKNNDVVKININITTDANGIYEMSTGIATGGREVINIVGDSGNRPLLYFVNYNADRSTMSINLKAWYSDFTTPAAEASFPIAVFMKKI